MGTKRFFFKIHKFQNKKEKPEGLTAVYARVSSSENKKNLLSQSKRVQNFCSAKGWVVSLIVEECASGLNDNRKKLRKLLNNALDNI